MAQDGAAANVKLSEGNCRGPAHSGKQGVHLPVGHGHVSAAALPPPPPPFTVSPPPGSVTLAATIVSLMEKRWAKIKY